MRNHKMHAIRRFLVPPAIAALAVLGLVSATAHAQTSELIFCFVPGTGVVYRVGEPGLPPDCLTTHGNRSPHIKFIVPAFALVTGNVGIGTATPEAELHVEGDVKVTQTLFVSSLSSNSPLKLQTRVGAGPPQTRIFVSDATNNGNVGIGTETPGAKLEVANAGTGKGASFANTNATNANAALEAMTNGNGAAARFENTNAANANAALEAMTNGNGAALEAMTNGNGAAARFENTNAANNNAALEAMTNGNGAALEAMTNGNGAAARFENTNAANNNAALEVSTLGSGPAATFDGRVEVDGLIQSTSGGFKFPDATVQTSAATSIGSVWGLSGNSGTTAGTDFLGTTDNQALELRVNGARALRLEPVGGGAT